MEDKRNEDSDDEDFTNGGLATPLSPPPSTHQTKCGLSTGRSSTPSSSIHSRDSPVPASPVVAGRPRSPRSPKSLGSTDGTIKILFSPTQTFTPSMPNTLSYSSTVATVATATATTLVYQHPGPPTVMPITAAATEAATPLSRSLTRKYIPAAFLPQALPQPFQQALPYNNPPAPPRKEGRFREVRESLWPYAFQMSPTRRHQHRSPSLRSPLSPLPGASPISPILPAPPPSSRRKTLMARIEGWWDLGLIRGGTIKGRAGATGAQPGSHTVETDMRQSPVAFV